MILFSSMPSNVMDQIIKFNSQSSGRDKLFRQVDFVNRFFNRRFKRKYA